MGFLPLIIFGLIVVLFFIYPELGFGSFLYFMLTLVVSFFAYYEVNKYDWYLAGDNFHLWATPFWKVFLITGVVIPAVVGTFLIAYLLVSFLIFILTWPLFKLIPKSWRPDSSAASPPPPQEISFDYNPNNEPGVVCDGAYRWP